VTGADDRVLGLARRFRPRRFEELVGQRHVTVVLRRAVAAGRVPQQLLFCGPSGLGKTTVARVCAAAMLCDNPNDGDACGVCESCADVFAPGGRHPDVVEFDAASNGGKDQIRELAARAATSPVRGKHRIYIIDEAHGLSGPGGQAFLKLLEEPPAHVTFMLATTDPDKMLDTNRGRCVIFELHRPAREALIDRLGVIAAENNWPFSPDQLADVADAADPALGIRGMLNVLEQAAWSVVAGKVDEVTFDAALSRPPTARIVAVWEQICACDPAGLLAAVDGVRRESSDSAVRRALISRARSAVMSEPSPLSIRRFELLADAGADTVDFDVAVLRAASPASDRSVEAVRALLVESDAARVELQQLIASARHVVDTEMVEEMEVVLTAPDDDASVGGHVAADGSPAVQSAAAWVATVAATDRSAAAILRGCTVTVDGAQVTVTGRSAALDRLRDRPVFSAEQISWVPV
jgi:DNA polymerase III subunit gamma/tau